MRKPRSTSSSRSTTLSRDELADAISKLEPIEFEYYVDSVETDADHSNSWCFKHAEKVAKRETRKTGKKMHAARSWSETDIASRCEYRGCDVALRPDGGGLTDYGIDSALGITEEKPLECHVYPAELVLSEGSMRNNDIRWPLWEWHAHRLLKLPLPKIEEHYGCGGVVLPGVSTGDVPGEIIGWRCTRCHKLCPAHETRYKPPLSCLSCLAGEGL